MATKTKTLLNAVKFNKLTRAQYDAAKASGQINENEFYMTGETLGEGDMLKSEYDSIFAGKELTLTGESIELKDSSEDRIGSIMINGYTVQEGTGDASPNNVREIENAGMYNKRITIDQDSPIVLSGTGSIVGTSRRANLVVTDLYPISNVTAPVKVVCNILPTRPSGGSDGTYTVDALGISVQNDSSTQAINFRVPGCMTEEDYKAWLTDNPLDVAYLCTTDTGEFYTGIEITQGDEYRCEIIELQAPLHEGDTMETNVQSEYDAVKIFNGSESNWKEFFSTKQGLFGIKMTDANMQLCASSRYAKASNPNIYVEGFCGIDNNLNFWVVDSRFSSVEDFKADLVKNNLPVFYKSASGGTGKNVRRETHNSKTRIITGTENGILFNPKYNSLSIKVDNLAGDKSQEQVPGIVKSSHFKTNAAVNGILAQPKYNQVTILSASVFDSIESAKAYFAQQYAAGTPVTIEYELAQPEVFANEPIKIKNPKGTFTISGEKNTNLNVNLKSIIDANFLNGRTWSDVEDYIDNKISSSSGSSVTGVKGNAETSYRKGNVNLTPADIGAIASTGGTVTGLLKLNKGYYIHSAHGTFASTGYVNVATITIKGNYQNVPICFEVFRRRTDKSSKLYLTFTPIDSTDPTVKTFCFEGDGVSDDFAVAKASAGKWNLYIKKTDAYDYIGILEYKTNFAYMTYDITFNDVHIDTLPSGAIKPTFNNKASSTIGTLTLQMNGTNSQTFNGSASKTVNITPSSIGTYTKAETEALATGINLLDNSNFLNPVNQRMSQDFTARGACIDRWKLWDDNDQQAMSVGDNGIYIKGQFFQILLNEVAPVGETYTFSVKAVGRDVMSITGTKISKTFDDVTLDISKDNSGVYTQVTITTTNNGLAFEWAKLEKGTIRTPYVPKNYSTELNECLRYFQFYTGIGFRAVSPDKWGGYITFPLLTKMRINPTCTVVRYTYKTDNVTDVQYVAYDNCVRIQVVAPTGQPMGVNVELQLSAEL